MEIRTGTYDEHGVKEIEVSERVMLEEDRDLALAVTRTMGALAHRADVTADDRICVFGRWCQGNAAGTVGVVII